MKKSLHNKDSNPFFEQLTLLTVQNELEDLMIRYIWQQLSFIRNCQAQLQLAPASNPT